MAVVSRGYLIISLIIISLLLVNIGLADDRVENGSPLDFHVNQHLIHDSDSIKLKLIDEPVCQIIRDYCINLHPGTDDLSTLECIASFDPQHIERIPGDCQHIIWNHKKEIIADRSVFNLTESVCADDNKRIKCDTRNGYLFNCLLANREVIQTPTCNSIIQRLENVAFSDFRLITPFIRDCDDDIRIKKCGRLQADPDGTSQGSTIACLQEQIDTLTKQCHNEILHLSELQSENIKADRQLFLACAMDLQSFCNDIRPGSGLVYKCLLKHRDNPRMSEACLQQLIRREKLIARDYKVSKGLAKSCKDDIKTYKCRRGVSDDKDIRLAQILLCLETVNKNNSRLAPDCASEIADHRRMLMEDYHMMPEILSDCAEDISKFCDKLQIGGITIHCLMEHARPKRRKENRVSPVCMRALESLVQVSDVGEDWRIDPVLRHACKPVVDRACHDTDGGDARVLTCLMEKINTKYMTAECETALMQIEYFIARNFQLDPQLYRACRNDAVRHCHARNQWSEVNADKMGPERGPLIFSCLYRVAYRPKKNVFLHPECLQEVKRVMRQRAVSVDLIPDVEDVCIDDLALYCLDKTEKNAEMDCLQDNLDNLRPDCRSEVEKYTEDEAGHIELNPVVSNYCKNFMEKYCANILQQDTDEGDMMECLIAHKNEPDMRQEAKCRAAVEHFQLISMKNFKFTYKFKFACKPYVTKCCPRSTTKYEVVACLSEVMRNDTLKGSAHTIPKDCRQQVRAQLYQQRENIDFNPKLKAACRNDLGKYCADIKHGTGQALHCLQLHHDELDLNCRNALFPIERAEMMDNSVDYLLMETCHDMINAYCPQTDTVKILDCLKLHKDKSEFDQQCHMIVVNRMIERNLDYRFNPQLQQSCSTNIAKYCTHIVASAKNEELNGKVLNCLKEKFRRGKLDKPCEKEIVEILREQSLNYKMNPLLQAVCAIEIKMLCKPNSGQDEHGEVAECLKDQFLQGRLIHQECKIEVATLIQESKADIQADPLLQRACAVDLLKYCSNIPSGNGRQLKCLQVILADESKALDVDCKTKLSKRMEMFKNAARIIPPPEDLHQLYDQLSSSPSRRYFILIMVSFIFSIFFIGIFCGRVTRRSLNAKNK